MCVGTFSGVTSAGIVISSARGGTYLFPTIRLYTCSLQHLHKVEILLLPELK